MALFRQWVDFLLVGYFRFYHMEKTSKETLRHFESPIRQIQYNMVDDAPSLHRALTIRLANHISDVSIAVCATHDLCIQWRA